jgi:hypothetical protein
MGSTILRKNNPTLVIPKPVLSVRNLLAAGSEAADSSRDTTALRNDNSLGFSNYTKRLRTERGSGRSVKSVAIQRFRLWRTMPVIYPVRDAPHAFEALAFRQENHGQLANELVAMLEQVQLLYKPGVFNIPDIRDQGHGAYS